jgi:hypothetical protein
MTTSESPAIPHDRTTKALSGALRKRSGALRRFRPTARLDRQADRFIHVRKLEDATHLTGGAPNNDTLYSRAWVYLKDEPVILTVPAIADRYYTMEIVDFPTIA